MLSIRLAKGSDKGAVWPIINAVIAGGDTYVYPPDSSEDEMVEYWFGAEKHTYVAELHGKIVATFWLKANQPGLGSHVGNAAYMVSPSAKRLGTGRQMAEYSIDEARRLGFTAMQFNFVVSTNERAVRLWQALGFEIVGTLPGAFRHSQHGFVDAYVMFRALQ